MGEWVLDASNAVEVESISISEGPLALSLGRSVAVPILLGERRIGLWLTGSGTAQATFADSGDAIAFADRQVMWLGGAKVDLAPIAHREKPYADAVREAFVVSGDVAWLDTLVAVGTPATAPAAVDASERLAVLAEEARAIPKLPRAQWLLVDALLVHRLGYVEPRPGKGSDADRRLTLLRAREPGAPVYTEDLAAVATLDGRHRWISIARPTWEEPDLAAERAGGAYDGVRATLTGKVTRKDAGEAEIEMTATYVLRARVPVDRIYVGPRSEHTARIALDGVEIDGGGVVPIGRRLEAGDELTVERTDSADVRLLLPNGQARDAARFAPSIGGVRMWPYTVAIQAPSDLTVALSGRSSGPIPRDGQSWTTSEGTGTLWIALGEWASAAVPAVNGIPSVRSQLFPASRGLDTMGPFVQTAVSYYRQLLPPLGIEEIDVVEAPAGRYELRWTAVRGLVTIQAMVIGPDEAAFRQSRPHFEESTLAHEVAHQWWGGSVSMALVEDHWLVESLAEAYACLFASAAFGPRECALAQDAWRQTWESRPPSPVASPPRSGRDVDPAWQPIAYQYGPYVLLRMLRPRIGDDAFLGGLDAFATRYADTSRASVASLETQLEASSHQDLGNFFDYWIDAGILPRVAVSWDASGATVTSDVPFGTFDLPIRITRATGEEEVRISVIDGEGHAAWDGVEQVDVDPRHEVLVSKLAVKRR